MTDSMADSVGSQPIIYLSGSGCHSLALKSDSDNMGCSDKATLLTHNCSHKRTVHPVKQWAPDLNWLKISRYFLLWWQLKSSSAPPSEVNLSANLNVKIKKISLNYRTKVKPYRNSVIKFVNKSSEEYIIFAIQHVTCYTIELFNWIGFVYEAI